MKIGFLGLLALVFITLKLCGVIAWSWWLVLLPLYFGVAVLLFFFLMAIIGWLGLASVGRVAEMMSNSKNKRK
ncbi:hypothetical protein HWD29_gp038 [Klebsiella phage KpS8]|uniref:Transmembrane protein n=1 Tax=Klebsiella phage KpS8 TaxID=2847815 RepID=A0A6H0X3Y9_9CAUD|nr:hypothetical protein HWD29_gp038 [Klebsiella phage KpS8]QIW88210.1 hypothetical protein kps8_038 [Klebsiella phage KpS8]